MAIEDKYRTDLIFYTLGRMAVDDFSELVVLAGNGWGIGALKTLRGMYERIVTAASLPPGLRQRGGRAPARTHRQTEAGAD